MQQKEQEQDDDVTEENEQMGNLLESQQLKKIDNNYQNLQKFSLQHPHNIKSKQQMSSFYSKVSYNSVYSTSQLNQISQKDLKLIAISILVNKPPGTRKPTDIMILKKYTSEILFFEEMEIKSATDAHKLCCKKLSYEFYEEGRDVITIGDQSDKFYIIMEGEASVLVPFSEQILNEDGHYEIIESEEEIRLLGSGEHFGEVGVIKDVKRSATVKTTKDSHLAVLKKEDFKTILKSAQEAELSRKLNFLVSLPLFNQLSKGTLEIAMYNFKKECFISKQEVFKQGTRAEFVYAVYQGEFRIYKEFDIPRTNNEFGNKNEKISQMKQTQIKKEFEIAVVGRGEFFGEIDCILNGDNKFSVQCWSQTGQLLKIARKPFMRRLFDYSSHPEIEIFLNQYLVEKVKFRNEKVQSIKQMIFENHEFVAGIYNDKAKFNVLKFSKETEQNESQNNKEKKQNKLNVQRETKQQDDSNIFLTYLENENLEQQKQEEDNQIEQKQQENQEKKHTSSTKAQASIQINQKQPLIQKHSIQKQKKESQQTINQSIIQKDNYYSNAYQQINEKQNFYQLKKTRHSTSLIDSSYNNSLQHQSTIEKRQSSISNNNQQNSINFPSLQKKFSEHQKNNYDSIGYQKDQHNYMINRRRLNQSVDIEKSTILQFEIQNKSQIEQLQSSQQKNYKHFQKINSEKQQEFQNQFDLEQKVFQKAFFQNNVQKQTHHKNSVVHENINMNYINFPDINPKHNQSPKQINNQNNYNNFQNAQIQQYPKQKNSKNTNISSKIIQEKDKIIDPFEIMQQQIDQKDLKLLKIKKEMENNKPQITENLDQNKLSMLQLKQLQLNKKKDISPSDWRKKKKKYNSQHSISNEEDQFDAGIQRTDEDEIKNIENISQINISSINNQDDNSNNFHKFISDQSPKIIKNANNQGTFSGLKINNNNQYREQQIKKIMQHQNIITPLREKVSIQITKRRNEKNEPIQIADDIQQIKQQLEYKNMDNLLKRIFELKLDEKHKQDKMQDQYRITFIDGKPKIFVNDDQQ